MNTLNNEILPFITVVMPVRNEEGFIRQTLESLVNQAYPVDSFEVIVADGQSDDSTREIVQRMAQRYPNIILKSNPGRLPSSGRNVGFRNGRGDIFLVIDGHCYIKDKYLLRNVADCFAKSGAYCLGRPQPFWIPQTLDFQRAIAEARSSWLGHSSNSLIHSDEEGFMSPVSVGCAYKRQVFDEIGFVDESFDACEDVEFNYRVEKANLKSYFSPRIAVYYYPRESLSALFRQLMRYGKGRSRFMWKHRETINLDMLMPMFFVSGFVLGPVIGMLSSFIMYLYLMCISVYLMIVSFESSRLSRQKGFRFYMKVFSAFLVIHFGLGTGIIAGFIELLRQRLLIPKYIIEKPS